MWVKNVTNGRTNGRTNGQGVSRRRIYKYFLFFKHLNIFRNSVSHAINLHCSHILMRICCITRSLREFTFGWMWSNLNSIQHYQDWVLPLCDLTETLKLITFLGSFQKPFFFDFVGKLVVQSHLRWMEHRGALCEKGGVGLHHCTGRTAGAENQSQNWKCFNSDKLLKDQ